MRVDFAFGKTGLQLNFPEQFRYRVLEARSAEPLDDPQGAIATALLQPIAGPPLAEVAKGRKTAAISVCDITRPAPNKVVLPHVLRQLEAAGVPAEGVTFLIATGLHRPATDSEIVEILGSEIAAKYRVINHDARNLAEHRHLGQTTSGTPVYIDERFMAAELHLTLGFVEPHLMLGFSGGRKLIAPGLAAQETIKVLHGPGFMRDARAVEGSVENNPLHRELLEIARMAGHHFLVDVALTRKREIAGVFAGSPVEAHAAGMRFVSKVMLEKVPEPADAVITSSAGYPLDMTFYQAIKGITAAQHIVKSGGKILLIAECQEGAGAAEFREMLKLTNSSADFLDRLTRSDVVVDQWQLEKLALVAQKAEILFYAPGLPAEYRTHLWGRIFDDPEAAIAALTEGLPRRAQIALMPEGPYVLAKTASAAA